ncbi:Aromatic amino acid exporter YddG [Azospirillaceae bacterium]
MPPPLPRKSKTLSANLKLTLRLQSVNETHASTNKATAIGAIAIILWATLPLFATLTGALPPFQIVAMTFSIGAVVGVGFSLFHRKNPIAALHQRPAAWLIGVGGLFGWHFCYFQAVRLAPPIEASMINYLWPLLMVLMSTHLPNDRLSKEKLRWTHAVGALSGLTGAALLITHGGQSLTLRTEHLPGYLAAAACAMIWSSYSVLSRRINDVPTEAVTGFCFVTALLATLCHALTETTNAPHGVEWPAIAMMGLGPIGAAFFAWDYGVKRGDIRLLGVFSYGTPLLATALMFLFGRAEETGNEVWTACALIIGGALLANSK